MVPNCVYQPPRNRLTVLSVASKPCWTWNGVHGLRSSFSYPSLYFLLFSFLFPFISHPFTYTPYIFSAKAALYA